MDETTMIVGMIVLILLLLLAINQVATHEEQEGMGRIPNWENRSREDKGLHDSPEDHTEAPRQYHR